MSSFSKSDLRIDWASHAAAKYACEHWHYSRSVPAGKLVKVGVWEKGKYIGAILFSRGANNNIGKPYGLNQAEVCELTRVALTKHQAPVSRIMTIAMRFLAKQSPGLRLIVSYADPEHGHHGGIYQATNWIYAGRSAAQCEVILNGKAVHKRVAHSKLGTIKGLQTTRPIWKHIYLMPLDPKMRSKVEPLAQPYPKRPKQASTETIGSAAEHHRPGRSLSTSEAG